MTFFQPTRRLARWQCVCFALTLKLLAPPLAQAQTPAIHHLVKNCELFIDKMIPIAGSHGARAFYVYLKIHPQALQGGHVVQAGFYASLHDPLQQCRDNPEHFACRDVGKWQVIPATLFANAKDYFTLWMLLDGDSGFLREYEGVFFVRTAQNHYYWLHKPGGVNFTLNKQLYQSLENSYRQRGWDIPMLSPDMEAIPKTADFLPEINPSTCR